MLTAYLRSFSLIGLQMGSPSRLTITAACLAEEDRRRIGLDPLDGLRHDLALVDVHEDAIERDHPLLVREGLGDLRHDFRNALLGQLLEIGLGDLQVLEVDEALVERHLGVGFELDRAQHRLLGAVGCAATPRCRPPCASACPRWRSAADTGGSCRRSANRRHGASRRRPPCRRRPSRPPPRARAPASAAAWPVAMAAATSGTAGWMRRVRAASRATPDRRGLAGFITRPLVAVQADSQSRAPVSCSGEKNSTGAVRRSALANISDSLLHRSSPTMAIRSIAAPWLT